MILINNDEKIQQAAQWLEGADGLLITAGAGMGVDSGLPDFRGPEGFWAAYPTLDKERISFESIASHSAFTNTPSRAWGFYAHRLELYRRTSRRPALRFCAKLAVGWKTDASFSPAMWMDNFRKQALTRRASWSVMDRFIPYSVLLHVRRQYGRRMNWRSQSTKPRARSRAGFQDVRIAGALRARTSSCLTTGPGFLSTPTSNTTGSLNGSTPYKIW